MDEHQIDMETITLAKIDILRNKNTSFLCGDLFKTQPIVTEKLSMPTAGTDGKDIFIHPKFWNTLSRQERYFIMFHEGFHKLFGHCNVRKNIISNEIMWNLATDIVINSIAIVNRIGTLPKGCIMPDYTGTVELKIQNVPIIFEKANTMSAEEVYWKLIETLNQAEKEGNNKKDSRGKHSKNGDKKEENNQSGYANSSIKVTDKDGNPIITIDKIETREFTDEEIKELNNNLRRTLTEELHNRGNMPSEIKEMIEGLTGTKINWRVVLRDAATSLMKTSQTFNRPNRRNHAWTTRLPGRKKDGVEAVIAIDTSGSIPKEAINYFTSEVGSIFKQFNHHVRATLLMHTCHVYQEIELKDVSGMKQMEVESGGTSHKDVFKRAEELNAKVLICLTDGESDFVDRTNIRKVVWIVTEKSGMKQIPDNLGKKIFVDLNELINGGK